MLLKWYGSPKSPVKPRFMCKIRKRVFHPIPALRSDIALAISYESRVSTIPRHFYFARLVQIYK